jgi:hypothetical protein
MQLELKAFREEIPQHESQLFLRWRSITRSSGFDVEMFAPWRGHPFGQADDPVLPQSVGIHDQILNGRHLFREQIATRS